MHKMFEGLRGKMFEFAEFTAYFSTLFPTSPFFVSIQFFKLHVVLHFWKVNKDNVHWTPLSIIMRADQSRGSNSTVHHLIRVYIHMQPFSQKKKKKKMQPRLFCFLFFFFSVPVNNKLVVMFVIFTH